MKATHTISQIPNTIPADITIGIITARFNSDITQTLEAEALATLNHHGITNIRIHRVPGAFELPVAATHMIQKKPHAIICIGCVIRGDTPHFDYICESSINGLMTLSITHARPIIMGILTTETHEQALERALPNKLNKGKEFAESAIELACYTYANQ